MYHGVAQEGCGHRSRGDYGGSRRPGGGEEARRQDPQGSCEADPRGQEDRGSRGDARHRDPVRTLQYMGKELSQEDMVAAVKAQWTGEEIKTLALYVKPEDQAVYYVVNGEGSGKVDL